MVSGGTAWAVPETAGQGRLGDHLIALIVFDIDGTLLQTHLVTVPAVQRTFAAHGLPEPEEEEIISFFGVPVEQYLDWLASLCSPERAAEIVDETNRLELDLVTSEGELYPGAREVLELLRHQGHALGICSNGPDDYVAEFLDGHEVRHYFDIVRTRGTKYPGKEAMLREILEQVAARPVIVVGDRGDDVAAAHANGAFAVGAGYGFGSADEIAQADATIETITDLPGIVESLVPC